MAQTLLDDGPVGLGTFTGPSDAGGDRRRWQLTVIDGGERAVLDREQAKRLLLALAVSLGWWCEPRSRDRADQLD